MILHNKMWKMIKMNQSLLMLLKQNHIFKILCQIILHGKEAKRVDKNV